MKYNITVPTIIVIYYYYSIYYYCSVNTVILTVILKKEFFFSFQTLDDWSFDVFALHESTQGQPIKYLSYDLLNRYGILHKFKVSMLVRTYVPKCYAQLFIEN